MLFRGESVSVISCLRTASQWSAELLYDLKYATFRVRRPHSGPFGDDQVQTSVQQQWKVSDKSMS